MTFFNLDKLSLNKYLTERRLTDDAQWTKTDHNSVPSEIGRILIHATTLCVSSKGSDETVGMRRLI